MSTPSALPSLALRSLLLLLLAGDRHVSAWTVRTTEAYARQISLSDHFKVFWNYDDERVTFELHVQTLGWIGFGFSPNGGMAGSDMILAWIQPGGLVHFSDRYATGMSTPKVDDSQDWKLLTATEYGDVTMVKVTRPLKTCDDVHDLPIDEQTMRLIWAWGPDDPPDDARIAPHSTHRRGTWSVYVVTHDRNLQDVPADAFPLDLLANNTALPAVPTMYWCTIITLPDFLHQEHHAVKIEAVVQPGNEDVVHHMVVYGCSEAEGARLAGRSEPCGENGRSGEMYWKACNDYFFVWATGGGPIKMPKDVGFPIHLAKRSKWVRLEIHYDNPSRRRDVVDGSGMRLWITPTLRKYRSGMWYPGVLIQPTQMIPPHFERYSSLGHCPSDCIASEIPATGVRVFAVGPHTHLTGVAVRVHHFRNNTELPLIDKDDHYDFNFQETRPLRRERLILPGDSVTVECIHDTTGRSNMTYGGYGTRDEMCIAYLLYYPLSELKLGYCGSAPSLRQLLTAFPEVQYEMQQNSKGGIFRITSPPIYANRSVFEIMNMQDWRNPDLRRRYQMAVLWGEVEFYCSISETILHVAGQMPELRYLDEPENTGPCISPANFTQTVSSHPLNPPITMHPGIPTGNPFLPNTNPATASIGRKTTKARPPPGQAGADGTTRPATGLFGAASSPTRFSIWQMIVLVTFVQHLLLCC